MIAYLPLMLKACATTLWLSWLAMLLGAFGGAALALLRLSRFAAIRWIAILYMEFFRSIPILIVMFFAYYGTPLVFGFDISPFVAATLALALHASATMSEVVHAGIASIGRGQWEAASAFGLRWTQTMRLVIAPQALRVILPPLGNTSIMLLKDSSIASTITVAELTRQGQLLAVSTFKNMTVYTLVALLYLAMSLPLSLLTRRLERRFASR